MKYLVMAGLVGFSLSAIAGSPAILPSLNDVIPESVQAEIRERKANRAMKFDVMEQADLFADYPSLVDMRSRDTQVKQQFGGTCTTFGLVAAMENVLGNKLDLSERHSWSKYRKYSVEAAVSALKNSGIVSESWWPQSKKLPYVGYKKQWWYYVSSIQYIGDNVLSAVKSLSEGKPVYIGFSTPVDLYNCRTTVRTNTDVYGDSGHAVAIVGYKLDPTIEGGGYFIFKNSWGSDCGDEGGYQYFPFSLCSRDDMYCMMWSVKGVNRY